MALEGLGASAGKEIANVITTTFQSPSSEIGNYIADKIRALRYKSLLKIVKRAEEQAREQHMQLKMPPLKFFVPFAEAASLEETIDDEATLRDAWARLLLSASQETDARHLLYLRILKEITGREIQYLTKMIEETRGKPDLDLPGGWAHFHYHDAPLFDDDMIYSVIRHIDPAGQDGDKLAQSIIDYLEKPGVLFHVVVVNLGTPYENMEDIGYLYNAVDVRNWESAVDVLNNLGLIRTFGYDRIPFERHQSYSAQIHGVALTSLGTNFYDVCSGKESNDD